MSDTLGTLEDLPVDYREDMNSAGVAPLWPNLRNLLPPGSPDPTTRAHHWSYQKVRPLLIRAGVLTPVEKAERRVLVLSDPGRGDGAMQATATIYAGLQLLLLGEIAPNHRHTPSAARIMVEGEGAYTVVRGEKLAMRSGDIVLTPIGEWHDHGHEGTGPVIWLDALDLPLFVQLEGSYSEAGELQRPKQRPDASSVEYRSAGLVPTRTLGKDVSKHPQLRFPWDRTEAALREIANYAAPSELVAVDIVNPETGDDVLPTIGFTAIMVPAGRSTPPRVRSTSSVFHSVSGDGRSSVGGNTFEWSAKDTFSAPPFAPIQHFAGNGPAFLIEIHDRPLQMRLGYYEERPA
jgi:gentisate 1,2-dioxygenase